MTLLTLIQQRTKDSMAQHPLYPPSLPPTKLELQSLPPRPGMFEVIAVAVTFAASSMEMALRVDILIQVGPVL